MAHSAEIIRQHRHNHGILLWSAPVKACRTAQKTNGAQRKEFRLTRITNCGDPADTSERFFKIGELPAGKLARCSIQRNAGRDQSLHVVAAIDVH